MAAVAFDTYKMTMTKMIKNHRAAGFSDNQAEADSSAVPEAEFAEVRSDLRLLVPRMPVKPGVMQVIITGLLPSAPRYLPPHP